MDKKWFSSACDFTDFSVILTASRNLSNQYDPKVSAHRLEGFILLLGIRMCAPLSSR